MSFDTNKIPYADLLQHQWLYSVADDLQEWDKPGIIHVEWLPHPIVSKKLFDSIITSSNVT